MHYPQAVAPPQAMARLAILAALVGTARAAIEATEASWDKDVMKPVEAGKYAFVKFLAPW